MIWVIGGALAASILVFTTYIHLNDRKLKAIPNAVLTFSPIRVTPDDVLMTAKRLSKQPAISIADQIPPRTGRRYIVVGGAGFLGGWIVRMLLERGEDPKQIRVLDIRLPSRPDLQSGPALDIDFVIVDISDANAVKKAFSALWPNTSSEPITVFHTAANILFYERHPELEINSSKVIVQGTENILNAAREVGVHTMIYTSSGSVSVRSSQFLLWPWRKEPKYFVQTITDDDSLIPKRHADFFSNYASTKFQAESLIRAADCSTSGNGDVLRTGCIRPGNGVFGPGGDTLCGAYLVRRNNPSWISTVVQNFTYVENGALAHLCYERRLIDLEEGSSNPDIGGQAFAITDPGPPPTYGDVYTALSTLTDGDCSFPSLSPTFMYIFAYFIEMYYLARCFYCKWLPPLNRDLVNLQPSLFNLVNVHLIFDDSRARLTPEKGGLGYSGGWTTLQAIHKLVDEHKKGIANTDRAMGAGIGMLFGFVGAQKGISKVGDRVAEQTGVPHRI